ncbi:hypothetical protein Patl1_13822 [Pistacia atlantica]|uniref:Uncharacterized protein n=1 Tax=Pistacia atlantica TaxID=434234 RepID=A0ACC1AWX8_9ROSI|nr:hypothetical protein Patl1_13822 [Pistacia atlantica]
MERRIYEAAVEGSVISLLNLLQEDALLLDRIMAGCYAETPLHVASMLGHTEFVQEILNRKPELAGELDSRKSSPLHLAAAKGYLDIVEKLVSINPEMCLVGDRDGRNPLHIAGIKGHVNVLRELVQARPQAARILMDRGGTILHVCVRYNQLESMKFLVETMNDHEFVNFRDDDGNSILHLAVADKQVEAIKFLITNAAIEVNALNSNGLTALDILTRSSRDMKDWEIGELLRHAGGISSAKENITRTSHGHGDNQTTNTSNPKGKRSKKYFKKSSGNDNWLEKKRTPMMMVASLIATMSFLASLNPPGGLWQDDFPGSNTTSPHRAGFAILEDFDSDKYTYFINYNTTSFVASLGTILFLLLIGDLPFFRHKFFMWVLLGIMWIAINATFGTYILSRTTLAIEASYLGVLYVYFVWLIFTFFVLLVHVIRMIVWMTRVLIKLIRRRRRRSASSTSGNHPPHIV